MLARRKIARLSELGLLNEVIGCAVASLEGWDGVEMNGDG